MTTLTAPTETVTEYNCKWVEIPQSQFLQDKSATRCGRYSQCSYNIAGFGINKWVVAGYLQIDQYDELIAEGKTEEEILEGCANFLSKPPPRKKYQKKTSAPLYGKLEPVLASWRGQGKYSFQKRKGFDNQFVVEFATDQRKNKNFWYEGPNLFGSNGKVRAKKKKKEK